MSRITLLAALLMILAALTGAPALASTIPAPVILTGLDLHDGTIVQSGGIDYAYGTRYGCGFQWGVPGTPWCGFGVATAASLTGPWTFRRLLFRPRALDNWGPDKGRTWDQVCGDAGAGCFNPRMLHRPDGVWVLWFNAPIDHYRYRANAYYVMGCNGPLGPCGYQAGKPYGSTHKPRLTACDVPGDFSVITDGDGHAAIICSHQTLSEQPLSKWWTDGTGTGTTGLAGLRNAALALPDTAAALAEGVGAFRVHRGLWEMTYSTPECGYCTGPPLLKAAGGANTEVQAGYAIAPTMLGPWSNPSLLSPAYCTGQPRTVFRADGVAWEWVDRWLGTPNETTADVLLEPMTASPWSCT
jgi:hypothetical protein